MCYCALYTNCTNQHRNTMNHKSYNVRIWNPNLGTTSDGYEYFDVKTKLDAFTAVQGRNVETFFIWNDKKQTRDEW